MANLRTPAEFKNCKLENPSLLFWLLAQYLGSDKRQVLSPCITFMFLKIALSETCPPLFDSNNQDAENRTLKGVMRVGPLSKGLVLHDDLNMELVALCAEKPTRLLLDTIVDAIVKRLQVLQYETYVVCNCKFI